MAPSTFAPGHHLVSRYRIEELLGVGQTAEVYLAQDLSLQRTVVVKVLLPQLAEHEDVRRAFRDAMMIPPGGAGLVPRPGRVAILRTADGVYARGAAPGTYAFIPDPTKLSTFPRALTLPVGLRCP